MKESQLMMIFVNIWASSITAGSMANAIMTILWTVLLVMSSVAEGNQK